MRFESASRKYYKMCGVIDVDIDSDYCLDLLAEMFFEFYGWKVAPHSLNLHISLLVAYVDSGWPVKIDINSREGVKPENGYIDITVYVDKTYDAMLSGEPVEDKPQYFFEEFLFHVEIGSISSSVTLVSLNVLTMLALYFLEYRYKIVSSIINELERKKRELENKKLEGDFDVTIKFFKWLRDVVFPLVDHVMDLSYIKNLDQLVAEIAHLDVAKLLSILEFVTARIRF